MMKYEGFEIPQCVREAVLLDWRVESASEAEKINLVQVEWLASYDKKFRLYPLGMGDLREIFEQINGFSEGLVFFLLLY